MRKVLITGGAGFIGANFVHHWLEAPSPRSGGGAGRAHLCGQPAQLARLRKDKADFRFVHGDICDESAGAAS